MLSAAFSPRFLFVHAACALVDRVYRGDWFGGVKHGCGACIWKNSSGVVQAIEGKFFADDYVGDVMPCSRDDATDSAVEADVAAYHARSFQVCVGAMYRLGL